MDATIAIYRLHEHRIWSKRLLLEACSKLDESQLRRSFPIGQNSLWATLLHLYAADFVWLDAILGNESPLVAGDLPDRLPGNQLGKNPIESLAQLTVLWNELDIRWTHYLQNLDASNLTRPIAKISTSSGLGKRLLTAELDVLLHLCTHSQYTIAQATNMLRHLGVQGIPDTMLITLSRSQNPP